MVVHARATNLGSLANTPNILQALQISYSKYITDILYLAAGTVAATFAFACLIQRKNMKNISKEKKQEHEQT